MNSLLKSSLILSAALLLGRLSGFVREMVLSAKLGVSAEADVAVLILTLPDFLVALLLTGGFSAALVPALRKLDPAQRAALLIRASLAAGVGFGVLSLTVLIWPGLVSAVFAPAMPEALSGTHSAAFRIMALSLPIAAMTGVTAAYLNAQKRFLIAGLGTLIYNLILIGFLVMLFDGPTALSVLGIAVVTAALLRWAVQIAAIRPKFTFAPIVAPGLARQFAAGVMATALLVLGPVIFRTIFSIGGEGQLAAFTYAQRLFDLPVGVLFATTITVFLPSLTDAHIQGRDLALLRSGLVVVLVLAIPTLLVGELYGDAIARLIYQRGAMVGPGMEEVIALTRVMFIALPFAGLSMLSLTALNAQGRAEVAMLNAGIALALSVAIALIWPGAVLAAFVIFHGLNAALNLWRSGVGWRLGWPKAAGRAMVLSLVILGALMAVDTLALPADALHDRALLGLVMWLGIIAVWWPALKLPRQGESA